MNYKNLKNFNKSKSKEDILISLDILEELLDFDSSIFYELINTFSLCFDSCNFIKCQVILIKEIIPFFQSKGNVIEQYNVDITFFINTFEENHIFNQFAHIIREKNELLLNSSILLFSLLSSLHKSFCQSIAKCTDLLDSLIFYILECDDKLFENSIVLFNNTLQFFPKDIDIKFINEFLEKIQSNELNTKIILNVLTNLIRNFNLPLNEYQYFIYMINLGISQSLFLDSMNLIYYCYQNEDNKLFLFSIFSMDNKIPTENENPLKPISSIYIRQLISASFLSNECFVLYFRILFDYQSYVFETFDVEHQNTFKSFILENFQIETLKNALQTNDPQILQYIFLFLSKSPHEIIARFTHECFEDEKNCINFIINCIIDKEIWLKKIAMSFLPIFLKEMGTEIYMNEKNEIKNKNNFFLNFLIDYNFLYTLTDLIEFDELETQKLALNFLNSMTSMNFFCQSYSKEIFEFLKENEFIQIIDELTISSEDEEISALAENVMNYFLYTMNDENDPFFAHFSENSYYVQKANS